MEDNNIYFYLPGFMESFEQIVIMAARMNEYLDHFYDNVKIGAVYGCPPGALWNGGRL